MATPLTSNLKKKTKYLKKMHRKTTHQGWDDKARNYEKARNYVKIVFDEDQTAFEAVTIESRNCAKLQK